MKPTRSGLLNPSAMLGILLLGGCTGSVANPGHTTANGGPPGTGSAVGNNGTGTGNTGVTISGGGANSAGISGGGGTGSAGVVVTGGGASTGTSTGTGITGPNSACDGLTSRRVRRLAMREYANVVSDLLGPAAAATLTTTIQSDNLGDNLVEGFDNQSSFLSVSGPLQEDIADLAATLSSQANPTTLAPCATAAGSPTCLQTFIRSFASKAYGRPMADDEFTRALAVANMGQDYATQVRLVVELILQSPGTLYVSELGSPTAPVASGQSVPLTQYEIASQLSFLLTGTRPDTTLLTAAQNTGFTKSTDILSEAQRLLATAPAKASLARFIDGWMDMEPLAGFPKDPTVFPTLTPAILTAMQQEFDQFVTTQLAGGDGTIASFMTGTSTNIPAALAPIYGTDLLPSGALDPKHRQGILSLPGVLTIHSGASHSGPVERGLLIRRQLLCQNVPGPPPNALAQLANGSPLDAVDTKTTTRQKLDMHLTDPSCAACHASFDPIGYGFEQMDGIGKFRTTENGITVDSTGQLTGTTAADGSSVDGPFVGPAQLSSMLAKSQLLESCMVDHFFSFSQARPTVQTDACVISDWASKFSQGGGHIKDLVLTAVVHPNFVNRKDDR